MPTRRNSWFARSPFVLIAALVTLAVSACSGGAGSSNTGDTITLGLPVEATTLTPVYLAEAQNLWAQQGLTVETVTFKGDAELAKAVLSGDVDVAIGSLTGPLTATEAGQDVKVFYGGFDMPAFAWYAVPDIHSLAEGKGQSWGVTTLGSSTALLRRYAASTAPGLVDTPLTASWTEAQELWKSSSPMRRAAQPSDVADLISAVVHNSYLTGEVIMLDGGLNLR